MSWATLADLREYLPQVSDLGAQSITLAGATGGTFTLSYEGASTAALAYNATATAVQTALRAIGAIGTNVVVTGRPGGPYVAKFSGALVTDAAPLVGDASLLTGTTPTITIASALDNLLQDCLDRATDTIRQALRAALADPLFDYAAYGAASTRIVRGYDSQYLRIPAHRASSVTLVEVESGWNPLSYTAIAATEYTDEAAGLYRPAGWAQGQRYRITAVWGQGPDAPDAVQEITLEQAVNIWRSRDKGGFTENVNADGPGSVQVVTGLTRAQQQTIMALRDQLIAIGV